MRSDQICVLYEDNHLLALFKPAGLLVQGDRTGDSTLIDIARKYIAQKYHKPGKAYIGLIHRLDRPVAGVVLFARTSKAAARLCEQIRTHKIKKTYWAIINGQISPSEGEIKGYILRQGRRSFISNPSKTKAKAAMLSYRTIEAFSGFSLIEIDLETGRHHQIRVQMASIGHHILGDKKYGSKFNIPGGNIALLAKSLKFFHPIRAEELIIESPIPDEWPWPIREKP